jgi:hypothetical protein
MADVARCKTLLRGLAIGLTLVFRWGAAHAQPADTLAFWNGGAARAAIIEFVEAVTAEGEPDYVPPEERIAVVDNDRTLWVEQPYHLRALHGRQRTGPRA